MAAGLALVAIAGIRNGVMELSGVGTPMLTLIALYVLAIATGLVVLVVLAGIRARAGKFFRYPLMVRFLKDRKSGEMKP